MIERHRGKLRIYLILEYDGCGFRAFAWVIDEDCKGKLCTVPVGRVCSSGASAITRCPNIAPVTQPGIPFTCTYPALAHILLSPTRYTSIRPFLPLSVHASINVTSPLSSPAFPIAPCVYGRLDALPDAGLI